MKPIVDNQEALIAFELTDDEREAFDFGCELMLRSLNHELDEDPERQSDFHLRDGIEEFIEIRNDVASGVRFLTRPGEWYLASCAMRRTVFYFNWSNLPHRDFTESCREVGLRPVQLVSYWIDAQRILTMLKEHGITPDTK